MTPHDFAPLLSRLPLPLAQALRRQVNAKSAAASRLAAWHFFETAVRFAAAAQAVTWGARGFPSSETGLGLGAFRHPEAASCLDALEGVSAALARRADAALSALAGVHGRLTERRVFPAATAFRLAARAGQDHEPRDASVLESFRLCAELGPAGAAATGEVETRRIAGLMTAAVVECLEHLQPSGGLALAVARDEEDATTGRTARIWLALTGDLLRVPVQGLPDHGPSRELRAGALALAGAGAVIPLAPFLAYERDSLERDQVGFLHEFSDGSLGYLDPDSGARIGSVSAGAELEAWLRLAGATPEAPAGPTGPSTGRTRTGDWIGDFEILGEIGRGGMAIVYRARQSTTGRLVALKVLPAALASDPVAVGRFRREVAALARCDHAHVVKVFAAGHDPARDLHWFAMEFVEGCDLAAVYRILTAWKTESKGRLKEGHLLEAISTGSREGRALSQPEDDRAPAVARESAPFPKLPAGRGYYERMAEVMADAARGVQHLHEHGIVHRDLKPGNIVLTADGSRAVVTDLGLAWINDPGGSLTASNVRILGTLRYMAPEQLQHSLLKVGPLADVYSLGATLYEMVCLSPVFDGDTEKRLIAQILREDPVAPRRQNPAVPTDLETVVVKCLAREPERRYTDARALADDLARFAAGEPIHARPATPLERVSVWARRRKNSLLAASLALAVGLGSAGPVAWKFWRRAESEKHAREDRERREREAGPLLMEARSQIERAVTARNAGDDANLARFSSKAVEILSSARKVVPDSAEACFELGQAFRLAGRDQDALAAYEEAVRLDPSHSLAWFEHGEVLLERLSRLHGEVTSAARVTYSDEVDFEVTGSVDFRRAAPKREPEEDRLYANAERDFREGLRSGVAAERGEYGRAVLDYLRSDFDSALHHLDSCLGSNPFYVEALQTRAEIFEFGKRDFARASEDRKRICVLRPGNIDASIKLASALIGAGRNAEAGPGVERLALAEIPRASTAIEVAWLCLVADRSDEGLRCLARARERFAGRPEENHIVYKSAEALAICGKGGEALALLDAGKDILGPVKTTALRGFVHYRCARMRDAIHEWRGLPAEKVAELGFIALWSDAEDCCGNSDKEKELLEFILRRSGTSLGKVGQAFRLLKSGEYERALGLMREAGAPEDNNDMANLAFVLWMADQYIEALETLERAVLASRLPEDVDATARGVFQGLRATSKKASSPKEQGAVLESLAGALALTVAQHSAGKRGEAGLRGGMKWIFSLLQQYYLSKGLYKEAVGAGKRFLKFSGQGAVYYYNARAEALRGREDEAIKDLNSAMELGFDDGSRLDSDKAFDACRNSERFLEIRKKCR